MKLVFIVALVVFLEILLLYRVYHRLPLKELKRRARAHEPEAAAIYKVAADSQVLDVLLILLGGAAAALLLIAGARYAWWLAVATIALMAWLLLWAPRPRVGGWLWRFAAKTSPYIFKILTWLHPVLAFIARLVPTKAAIHVHTGAYEKEDLLELLAAQATQTDNRISETDLQIAAGALTFGDKKVGKVMTPRREIKMVGEDDVVGPMLMDELHKSGFSRFPVVKGSAKASMPTVTGTLYLKDIVEIGQENKGKVKDHMKRGAYFINETCTLEQALDAVLKGRYHQLIVVNNFEEMVGVITLEDILEQILGRPIVDEFDKYDNLRSVANIEAEREKLMHREVVPEAGPEESAATEELPTD